MDDALVPWQNRLRVREFMIVLILVLMDDALVHSSMDRAMVF